MLTNISKWVHILWTYCQVLSLGLLDFKTLINWFSYELHFLILSLGATETKTDLFLRYCLPKGQIWIVVR